MIHSKIKIIEAPQKTKLKGIKVFIAGGISNCPDWQSDLIARLQKDERFKKIKPNILIFNPRRKNKPKASETETQITWEFYKLNESDIVSFWFSEGSLNPIVLFEYGRMLAAPNRWSKHFVVGYHENYQRYEDVIIQTKLIEEKNNHRPKIEVKSNFDDFYEELAELIECAIIQYNFKVNIK